MNLSAGRIVQLSAGIARAQRRRDMRQTLIMLPVALFMLAGGACGAAAGETKTPIVRPNVLPKPPLSHLIRRKGDEKPAPAPQ
jgi:hypothetical protein